MNSYTEELNNNNYLKEAKWQQVSTTAAIVAILVSFIGLLGLTVLSTANRAKEIGIKKVLGSSISQIVFLFTADFLKLISIGILLGLPIAWWMKEYSLQTFAYQAQIQWWLFAVCGGIVMIIALIPIIFQSLNASLENPADSLSIE